MKDKVCAVTVSYNAPEKLHSCIISVLPQVEKVVVIDNHSEKKIENVISRFSLSEKFVSIYNSENMGLGYAFNQGIKYSISNGYKWTLLLDQDSVLVKNMIQEMLGAYLKLEKNVQERTMLLVPRINEKNTSKELPAVIATRIRSKKLVGSRENTFVNFQISSGTLLKNELVEKIGLLNEKLFIDYIDYDYCFRVLDGGYLILKCGGAFLNHSLGEANTKKKRKYSEHSASRVYYQTRNGLYIVHKYGKKYRSIAYAEIYRVFRKIPRIIILETNKIEKLKMYFKGLIDFILYHKHIDDVD